MDKNGILLIDKEVGWTSRDCVNKLMHVLNTKKIGHAGTLDPFATGLLLIGYKEGTKILSYLEAIDKTYYATLKLGIETDTMDNDGTVIASMNVPYLQEKDIKEYFASLIGEMEQLPPMYSAIKQNGIPLYKLARKGIEVERESRKITIFELELITLTHDEITFKVRCSKGTYVRVLAHDIALAFNCVGHLTALRRTAIGNFDVANSTIVTAENLKSISLRDALSSYPHLDLSDEQYQIARHGGKLSLGIDQIVVTYYYDTIVAIYELDGDMHRVKRGFVGD